MTPQEGQGRGAVWGPHCQARQGTNIRSFWFLQGARERRRQGRKTRVRNQQVRDDQMRDVEHWDWGEASQKPTGPVPRTCSSPQRAQWGAQFSWGHTELCTVTGAEVIWRAHAETTQRGEGSTLDGEGVGHPQGEGEES